MVLNSNHVCSPKGAPGRPNQSRTLLERSTRLEKSCDDETTLLKRSRERLRETPRQSPVLMTSQRIRHTGKRALSISFIGFVRERIVRRQYRFIFFSDWLVVRRTTNNFNHAIDRTTHRLSNFLKDSPTPKPAVFLLKKERIEIEQKYTFGVSVQCIQMKFPIPLAILQLLRDECRRFDSETVSVEEDASDQKYSRERHVSH